jgi:NADH-ubiquinone oxidoreductase chain 5
MYLIPSLFPIFSIFLISLTFRFYTQSLAISFIFFSLIISLLACLFMIYEVVYLNSTCYIAFAPWFKLGTICINWSFYFDKLNIIMLFVVICISLCVHLFAIDYLGHDPHLSRFLILLYIFTIFMQILVTSGNLIQLFLGWEGIGLMSYLLINFWFTRYEAANSGLMAIIYNRVGDCDLF